MQKKLTSVVVSIAIALGVVITVQQDADAQNQPVPTVTMVTLQTMPGQNGQQMVVTPKGKVVPLPGPGVNSNVVQVFIGSQGGAWYVDKNNQQVDLTQAIAAFQRSAGNAQTAQVPQYAPQPVVNNNYYDQNGSSSSSSGGSSAGTTALAAGLGAATGAALTNTLMDQPYYYHGVPYGYPVAYGANNKPYYVNNQGKNVYVGNNDVNVNKSASYNNATVNQANVNSYHANTLQNQQNWYNKQVTDNTGTFKNWQGQQDNPFVHPDANSWASNANADGSKFANSGKGRFGRGGDNANGGGGLFNRGGDNAGGAGFGGGRRGGGRFR